MHDNFSGVQKGFTVANAVQVRQCKMLRSGMVSELDNKSSPLRLPHHGKPCTPRQ